MGKTVTPELLRSNVFHAIQNNCFQDMVENTFMVFKKSPEFSKYQEAAMALEERKNKVLPSDFEYLELLGEGGYGRVVRVRKISTGVEYAMKIQLKTALIKVRFSPRTQPLRLAAHAASLISHSRPRTKSALHLNATRKHIPKPPNQRPSSTTKKIWRTSGRSGLYSPPATSPSSSASTTPSTHASMPFSYSNLPRTVH